MHASSARHRPSREIEPNPGNRLFPQLQPHLSDTGPPPAYPLSLSVIADIPFSRPVPEAAVSSCNNCVRRESIVGGGACVSRGGPRSSDLALGGGMIGLHFHFIGIGTKHLLTNLADRQLLPGVQGHAALFLPHRRRR